MNAISWKRFVHSNGAEYAHQITFKIGPDSGSEKYPTYPSGRTNTNAFEYTS